MGVAKSNSRVAVKRKGACVGRAVLWLKDASGGGGGRYLNMVTSLVNQPLGIQSALIANSKLYTLSYCAWRPLIL